jgi:hypothetical protein
VAAVPEGPALAATFAIRQQRTPTELLSQVLTTLGSLKIGAFSIGAAIAGPLTQSLGPRTTIAVVAAMQIVAVGLGVAMRVAARPAALSDPGARRSGA